MPVRLVSPSTQGVPCRLLPYPWQLTPGALHIISCNTCWQSGGGGKLGVGVLLCHRHILNLPSLSCRAVCLHVVCSCTHILTVLIVIRKHGSSIRRSGELKTRHFLGAALLRRSVRVFLLYAQYAVRTVLYCTGLPEHRIDAIADGSGGTVAGFAQSSPVASLFRGESLAGFFCVRFAFSPRSSVTMKGGWAGAKVASASEEPGCARRRGVPQPPAEDTVGSAHTQGGGTGMTGAADRSAQRAVSRAESFPHKGEIRSLVAYPPCRTKGQPTLGPRLRAAHSVFSEIP